MVMKPIGALNSTRQKDAMKALGAVMGKVANDHVAAVAIITVNRAGEVVPEYYPIAMGAHQAVAFGMDVIKNHLHNVNVESI